MQHSSDGHRARAQKRREICFSEMKKKKLLKAPTKPKHLKKKIYDKPKKFINRVLLYETTDVASNEFTTETKEMIENLKKAKSEENTKGS